MQPRRPKHRSHIEEYQGADAMPATFGRGRRCRSCDAWLSIYNEFDRCAPCFPQGRRMVKISSRDHEAEVIDFQELLEDPYSEVA